MKKHFRPSEEYRRTTNRSAFNKLHKRMLERKGKIHCSFCGYHRGENDGRKYYGEIRSFRSGKDNSFRYPNWKLSSKKEKQWMNGTYTKITRKYFYSDEYYVEFKV